MSLLQVLPFPADNFVPLIPEGLREEGEAHGGREGSLTEEAAQLLKLWPSLSGETEVASTMAAERYKTKALPLKHRPWRRQGSGVFRARGKVWALPNLRSDRNCTLGVVRSPSGQLGGGYGMRAVRRQLISVWGGEGYTPARTQQTLTPPPFPPGHRGCTLPLQTPCFPQFALDPCFILISAMVTFWLRKEGYERGQQ